MPTRSGAGSLQQAESTGPEPKAASSAGAEFRSASPAFLSPEPMFARPWFALRLSQSLLVASVALWATLVAFGNITDYGVNYAFVQHVLAMDTIFPTATIHYRAIASPGLHHVAYALIIFTEALVAVLCWWGAWRLWRRRGLPAAEFRQVKGVAILGLTLACLLWLVGFSVIGGEWFGMWMSEQWNGIQSAFRLVVVAGLALVVLILRDD